MNLQALGFGSGLLNLTWVSSCLTGLESNQKPVGCAHKCYVALYCSIQRCMHGRSLMSSPSTSWEVPCTLKASHQGGKLPHSLINYLMFYNPTWCLEQQALLHCYGGQPRTMVIA